MLDHWTKGKQYAVHVSFIESLRLKSVDFMIFILSKFRILRSIKMTRIQIKLGVNSMGLKVMISNANEMDRAQYDVQMLDGRVRREYTASTRMKLHGAFKIQLNRKFSQLIQLAASQCKQQQQRTNNNNGSAQQTTSKRNGRKKSINHIQFHSFINGQWTLRYNITCRAV